MNYNLEEYKRLRRKEIEYFLRGINFDNIEKGNLKIVDYLSPECSAFFNESGSNRIITEEFLVRIKEHYNNFIYTDLEFASSEEEVDSAIKVFVDKVRKDLDEYKYTIIKENFIDKKKMDEDYVSMNKHKNYNVKENNLINLGLNFIKIQIGDKVFTTPKSGTEAEKEEVTLDNLNIMLVYVYVLLGMINDKKVKKEELTDYNINSFEVSDPRFAEIHDAIFTSYLNIKNYEDYVTIYNQLFEQIVTGVTKRTMLDELSKLKEKNNGIITSYLTTDNYEDFVEKFSKLFEQIESGKSKQTMINELSKLKEKNNGKPEDILALMVDIVSRENDYKEIKTIYYKMKELFPQLFFEEQYVVEEEVKPKARG